LADKADKKPTLDLLKKAMDVAQKAFKPVRPTLAKGPAELSDLPDSITKDAKALLAAAREMDEGYKACAQAMQDNDEGKVAKAIHSLATGISGLKNVFSQMANNYGKTASHPTGSPPWHKASEADEALAKSYLALQNLKSFFDSMQEIPPQYSAYYRTLMLASSTVADARRATSQVRALTQKASKL
jgi:uncharacterized phage infection (PIP) family protein YhgE